mmetsp:Transcript_67356/g.161493  ORF Transcript_67356/g.161493 Transcript_67356/m.161493 type:complete len:221 (+) Transcript_67356:56-718(+)
MGQRSSATATCQVAEVDGSGGHTNSPTAGHFQGGRTTSSSIPTDELPNETRQGDVLFIASRVLRKCGARRWRRELLWRGEHLSQLLWSIIAQTIFGTPLMQVLPCAPQSHTSCRWGSCSTWFHIRLLECSQQRHVQAAGSPGITGLPFGSHSAPATSLPLGIRLATAKLAAQFLELVTLLCQAAGRVFKSFPGLRILNTLRDGISFPKLWRPSPTLSNAP